MTDTPTPPQPPAQQAAPPPAPPGQPGQPAVVQLPKPQWVPPPGWPPQSPPQRRPAAPLFGVGWPGPSEPPSSAVLVATTTAGVAAAVFVPLGRPGIGWLLAAVVLAALSVVFGWHSALARLSRPAPLVTLQRAGWAVAAVALAGVGTVRAAEWLVALCLLAACAAGSLAVAGPWFRTVAFGALSVAVAALRALPWIGPRLLTARARRDGRGLRVAASAIVALALLGVFGSLLASADAAFARVMGDLLPTIDGVSVMRWLFLFALFGTAMAGACFLLVAPPTPPDAAPRRVRLRGIEWELPVGLLALLFALFVGVQFAALFGGDDYVQRTTGLTYAEYARSGFWQLLVVTALTLVVIVLANRWAPERTPAERLAKRGLLGALAALTLIIVASALSRMWVYQQAYGFTVLRLLVLTCELWLGASFLLALVGVLRLSHGRLARGMAAAGVGALLSLAVLDAEQFIAEQNVQRFNQTGQIDTLYLSGLSADAVPALASLPEPQLSCAVRPIVLRLGAQSGEEWRSWNASRADARAAFPNLQPSECRS